MRWVPLTLPASSPSGTAFPHLSFSVGFKDPCFDTAQSRFESSHLFSLCGACCVCGFGLGSGLVKPFRFSLVLRLVEVVGLPL